MLLVIYVDSNTKKQRQRDSGADLGDHVRGSSPIHEVKDSRW